jgi:hypothetical protein
MPVARPPAKVQSPSGIRSPAAAITQNVQGANSGSDCGSESDTLHSATPQPDVGFGAREAVATSTGRPRKELGLTRLQQVGLEKKAQLGASKGIGNLGKPRFLATGASPALARTKPKLLRQRTSLDIPDYASVSS